MTHQEYLRAIEGIDRLGREATASPEAARAFIKLLGGRVPRTSNKKIAQSPVAAPPAKATPPKKAR